MNAVGRIESKNQNGKSETEQWELVSIWNRGSADFFILEGAISRKNVQKKPGIEFKY